MNPAIGLWAGLPRWLQQALVVIGFVFMFLLFGRMWLEAHDMQVRKKITDQIRQRELEEEIKLREQAKETIHEIDTRMAAADDALNRLPQFKSARELRDADPDLAELILGDPVGDDH